MKIKIIYKKLGREKLWGEADLNDNTIFLDERLKGKKHLEILTHETLHLLLPEAEEDEIIRISATLIKILWKENYRRIETDDTIPLQDGTI
jgi:hypothetical protein